MAEGKTMTPVVALRNFFGLKQGQTTADFIKEVKALSPEERTHLAKLAGDEMGVTIVDPKS